MHHHCSREPGLSEKRMVFGSLCAGLPLHNARLISDKLFLVFILQHNSFCPGLWLFFDFVHLCYVSWTVNCVHDSMCIHMTWAFCTEEKYINIKINPGPRHQRNIAQQCARGCFINDTLQKKKMQYQDAPLPGVYKLDLKEFFS